MNKLRIMSVFGTRPEAIKMCPLVKELASRPEIESLCCVTAQHREMLDSVMEVFDLKADCDLDIMTPRQTLSTITSKCLLGMDDAIEQLKPDMILVHGDTSTTFAGALSAFYHKVPVGHVEAGLRTYDKYSPFPEEMNRKLVTAIADLYFCPTKNNRENLLKECVTEIMALANPAKDAESVDMDGAVKYLNANGYRIKKSQLYKLTSAGEVPFHKFGSRLHFRIAELTRWASERLINGNAIGVLEPVTVKPSNTTRR